MAVFKSKCKLCVKPCEHGKPKGKCKACNTPCDHAASGIYRFQIRGVRYTRAVLEAATKWQAEQAEAKAKNEVYEGKYGREPSSISLKEFVDKVFLPWAKSEKRSWRNDISRSKPIVAFFKSKRMRDITNLNVRAYRKERLASSNGRGGLRAPASVDREIQLLSRIFSLAVEHGQLQANPCKGIKLANPGNIVIKYLTVEDEEKLRPYLTGRRKHLLDILEIDLHTGMRRTELLSLHVSQINFIRDEILLTKTKSGKPRLVPIHPNIRPTDSNASAMKPGRTVTCLRTRRQASLSPLLRLRGSVHCAGCRHSPYTFSLCGSPYVRHSRGGRRRKPERYSRDHGPCQHHHNDAICSRDGSG